MVGIPSTLIERLRTRQALLVAGLGSCSLAGLPGWPETLRRMAARLEGSEAASGRRLIEQLLAQGRRAAVLAYLRAHLTPRALVESLREAFPPGLPVPEALALLVALPWRAVLVTGFDDLWDRALGEAPEPYRALDVEAIAPGHPPTSTPALGVAAGAGRYFFHVLGTAEATQRLCLGVADLRRGTVPAPAVSLVRESFHDRSFVFFGFEPTDPDLELLTQGLLGGAATRAEHFLLWANAPQNDRVVDLARAELGFTVVPCAGSADELARRLVDAWRDAEAETRPRDDDVQAWLELALGDPADPEPRVMLERLETHLRAEKRTGALVSLLVGRAALEPERAVALELEAAGMLADELKRPEAAVAMWRRALAHDPSCEEAGERLAAHLRRAERWRDLAETLEARAAAAPDRERKLALWREAVALRGERLQHDPAATAAAWEAVAELAPGDLVPLRALVELYRGLGREREAVRAEARIRRLEADAALTAEHRRALLADVGRLFEDELGDVRAAREAYVAASAAGDERAGTLEALARLHRAVEDWPAGAAALEKAAAAAASAGEGVRAAALRVQAAHLLVDRLGDAARAEELCLAALEVDPDSVAALETLARVCLGRGDHQSAVGFLLDAEPRTADRKHKARLLADAATILERHLAAGPRAQQLLERAVALDPDEPGPAIHLCALLEAQERWADARPLLEAMLQRAGDAKDPAERLELLRRLSRAAAGAGDRGRARAAQAEIVDRHLAAESWREAALALEALAGLEDEPAAGAAAMVRAALLVRDRAGDRQRAHDLLARALEIDPTATAALDALEGLMVSGQRWKELAQLFERLLGRIAPEGHRALRARLHHSLGVLYVQLLGDESAGRASLEAAHALEPDHPDRPAMLADLYVKAGPSEAEKAITLHQRLVAADPNRLVSYRALARLYQSTGAIDELWCVASTLTFLRKADAPLLEIYERHRKAAAGRPPADKLPSELWARLAHPDEDPQLARIFALIGHLLASEAAESHGEAGLRRDDSVDPRQDVRPAARALAQACLAFDVPTPDLFFSMRESRPVVLRNFKEDGRLTPALVVGAPLVARTEQSEVTFAVGRAAALLRPEKFPRCLDGRVALSDALEAAMVVGGVVPAPVASEDSGPIAGLCRRLESKVTGAAREELCASTRELAGRGASPLVEGWRAGADLSAGRAAFALIHDLGAVARAIAAEPGEASPLPAKRRLKDLVAFSVSDTYFSVRRALGVAIR